MTNFIPNEIKKIVPRDPAWKTKPLITVLNRKNRLFKNYERHGYKPEDKVMHENFDNVKNVKKQLELPN